MFAHDDPELATYLSGVSGSAPATNLIGTNSDDTIEVNFGAPGDEIYAADGDDTIHVSDLGKFGGRLVELEMTITVGGSGNDKLVGGDGRTGWCWSWWQ